MATCSSLCSYSLANVGEDRPQSVNNSTFLMETSAELALVRRVGRAGTTPGA
jgi:hypothetical protein